MKKKEITELLKYSLCDALEGGANYWYQIQGCNRDQNIGEYHHEVPFRADGKLHIGDVHNHLKGESVLVTEETLFAGLKLMKEKYPNHYNDFINDNGDAETGDVLLQLAMFSELVFG